MATVTTSKSCGVARNQGWLQYNFVMPSFPSGATPTRYKVDSTNTQLLLREETASSNRVFDHWYDNPSEIILDSGTQARIYLRNDTSQYITATVTITFEYTDPAKTITVNAGTGGSATASEATATAGTTVTITCTPSTGYKANTPTATGITFTAAGTNKWTFTMPSSDVTVSCTFSKIDYTITMGNNPAAGGSLSCNKTGNKANYGDEVTLTRTAAAGYQFSSWTKTPSTLSINSSLKFTMPAQNVSITANWTKISYNVTVNAGSGGTASSNKATAQIGDTVTITCTPSAGYTANTPTATGISFTAAGTNKWTFTMQAAAVTISCTFSKISYTITKKVSPSGAGTVTAASTAQVGDQVSISQTPETGYYFNGWTFSPSGPTVSSGKFTMPASNVTVTANYLKRSTGSLSSSSMTGNGTVTLTIVPDKASYSHKYKLSFGTNMETGWVDVAAGTNSVTINVPDSWSDYIPNATSKSGGTLVLKTYSGTTEIGSYTISSLTYNVRSGLVPSIGTITTSIVRTVGGVTYANVGDYYVQGKCAVRTQASASGARSSTITSIELTMSGYTDNSHKKTVSAASIDFTSGLLTVSGTCTITLKATDSRGRTTTKTKTITVTAYNPPSGTLTVKRVNNGGTEDPNGTYATYQKTSNYTQVGSNSLSVSLSSQGSAVSNPANSGNLLPNNRQSFSATQEYTITMTLTDAFGSVTVTAILPTARWLFFVNADGDRIAFMKATNNSLSKNGKSGTIEFSGEYQLYIGSTTLEDYIRGVINGTI